ncbi:hypothetical protein SEA_SUCCESS_76 [Streptomyces phage Success]|uniref:Uncharacterized protein n=1 Tax=Streptomyces phage Success TaxID=2999013 RepID=A0A9E8S1Q7_9CAUD|nr:hypothetical protein QEH47_gp56 [Streptomyces phage Success]WAB08855.1 hypothetical protein SEA_SUCCESS_76 [Streptomyces phage Success]
MGEPTVIHVDRFERGKALVTLPNGGARIGREDGAYWIDCTEWEGSNVHPLPYKSGFASYKAAAKWMARTMGHTGPLDIQEDKEF